MGLEVMTLSDSENPIVRGDTWDGFEFNVKVNGEFVDLTDAEVRIQFSGQNGDGFLLTSPSTIEIDIPLEGHVIVKPISRMDYIPDLYVGDLEITDSDNIRTTFCLVKLLLIDDITK